jgi:hypothetical protein
MTLKNWIAAGAPNCEGYVNFSDNPARKKFYVCMQPCNQVAVFDAETRVIMRYVQVGNGNGGPHQVALRLMENTGAWFSMVEILCRYSELTTILRSERYITDSEI